MGIIAAMQVTCVGCGAVVPWGAQGCPSCGRPTDLDGNGLPDSMDRLVEAAAQKAVAAERAKESSSKAAELGQKRRRMAEASLRRNLATPRTWTALAWRRFWMTAAVVAGVLCTLGMPVQMLLRWAGLSVAGPVVCAIQCPDCRPSGRAFQWSYRGPLQENKGRMGSAYVCRNPIADVDRLEWSDVRSEPLNTKLQPYMVHQAWLYLGDPFAWGFIVAVLSIAGTGGALRRLDEERAALERTLRQG